MEIITHCLCTNCIFAGVTQYAIPCGEGEDCKLLERAEKGKVRIGLLSISFYKNCAESEPPKGPDKDSLRPIKKIAVKKCVCSAINKK